MNSAHVESLAASAADVAGMLRVSTRQIWAMHASGQLGPVPVTFSARLTRWDAAEIRAWWDACRVAGRRIGRSEWLKEKKDNYE